ncbi:hypothetical protein DFJ73DRAFT_767457 [Zopfochytrium polystomum]|nr:hypothetical protein DFJ73DRAFT_767457 [Zopfochytrium polystomum]
MAEERKAATKPNKKRISTAPGLTVTAEVNRAAGTVATVPTDIPKKRRGRPPGSTNRKKPATDSAAISFISPKPIAQAPASTTPVAAPIRLSATVLGTSEYSIPIAADLETNASIFAAAADNQAGLTLKESKGDEKADEVVNSNLAVATTLDQRHFKCNKQSAKAGAKWTKEMVEALLTFKEITYQKYFLSRTDKKARGKGWAKVTLAINSKFDLEYIQDQVTSKYERLTKKWKDFGPNGVETAATGNNPMDLEEEDEDEMGLLAEYMGHKPGRGSDLGQGSVPAAPKTTASTEGSLVDEDSDSSNDDKPPAKKAKGEQPVEPKPHEKEAALARSLDSGFLAVAGSFSEVAMAIAGKGISTQTDAKLDRLVKAQEGTTDAIRGFVQAQDGTTDAIRGLGAQIQGLVGVLQKKFAAE